MACDEVVVSHNALHLVEVGQVRVLQVSFQNTGLVVRFLAGHNGLAQGGSSGAH